jgi:CelD/BcsL family acetyltransferase involved in cellulose biosynthesis
MPIAADFAPERKAADAVPLDGIAIEGDLDVAVVSDPKDIDAIAAEWRALEALSDPSAMFQSVAQVRIWARHFVSAGSRTKLHIAVVRRGGQPVLILPLVIGGLPGLRIAEPAGAPIAQYSDLLVDPAVASRAAFEAALASVAAAGADAIVLRRVRKNAAVLRLAAPFLRPPIGARTAPYADLAPFATSEAYLRSLSKRMRQSLRNRGHHLDKAGEHAFELLPAGPEARAAVAAAIDLKRKWLVQRGNLSTAFVDSATRDCLLDLAASPETGAIVTRLMVGGEPAAVRFGFEHRGTHFAYLSAYDPRFGDVSPGKLLMQFVVSGFKTRGFDRLDMLPPGGRHKSDWCKEEMEVADYTLPLTRAGRLYAELYQERLRPTLKRAWDATPAPLRSLAAALFLRV